MRTVQMTLDNDLVEMVDRAVKEAKTTRSAFTRDALRLAIKQLDVVKMEEKHRKGYAQKPAQKGEFDLWESEQKWCDE